MSHITKVYLPAILPVVVFFASCGGGSRAQLPDKTTFQTSAAWRPTLDNRADAVMIYGVSDGSNSLEMRKASWEARGYRTMFMAGIAWGNYGDYFSGKWDGRPHFDEGQVDVAGDTLWHGKGVPYIVPTKNYLAYFKDKVIKRVIDAGIDDIFLEEPEFWAGGGYSESFKREWADFYGTPWQAQDSSPEATYLSNKLKYHLYYRALQEAFTFAKEYGRSLGRDIRCYVPTHSLINYSQWQIVSPEASLASMPCIDGYIAQVWTGTSRVPNYYGGVLKERVFETAYLEYGCMASMTAPTGRRLWFLTDPIEDRPRDWEDFKRNYQATFTAQLMYPQIADYEIMPWPERIYEGLYHISPGSEQKARIPEEFATMMQVMIASLGHMPSGEAASKPYSVLMANSMMFQAFPQHEGYEDPALSNFFGLAMPLLKRGCQAGITHIENLGYTGALKGTEVLLMSYAGMKPMSGEAHIHLADWVRKGGKILYCGADNDPFRNVPEWWNSGDNHYSAPSDHLFELLNIPAGAPSGLYLCGKGSVYVLRKDPKDFVIHEGGEKTLFEALSQLHAPARQSGLLRVDRGPYIVLAALDETSESGSYTLEGCFIDLFDASLPVYERREIFPGERLLLYDVGKAGEAPKILASAGRSYNEEIRANSFSFLSKGPAETKNICRILLPSEPVKIGIDGAKAPFEWHDASHTCLIRFPNSPEGVKVSITW